MRKEGKPERIGAGCNFETKPAKKPDIINQLKNQKKMKEQEKSFAAQVVADETAKAHAEEIQKTRVGGLGGSDAAMVLRVATKGLAGLTATDLKRLCVMVGTSTQEDWGGNAYTNAGHAFEDFAENNLPFNQLAGYEREKLIEAELALNFKTFAHADFVTGKERLDVVECKFVQLNTLKVAAKYWPQLQWYYMLGAKSVTLYHGIGNVEPFEVEEATLEKIDRDQETIDLLLHGIKLLDDALTNGWRPEPVEKEVVSNTPDVVQKAFEAMADIKEREKVLAAEKAKASEALKQYCEDWGFTGILADDGTKRQVIYTKAGVSKTFDAAAFLKDHPEFNNQPEYWKTTKRASSVSFK